MKNLSLSVKFTLYKAKTLKNGNHPIWLVATKDRVRKFCSTGLDASPKEWDEDKERLRKNATNYKTKNETLDSLEERALKICNELKKASLDDFMEAFKQTAKTIGVFAFFDQRIKEFQTTDKAGNAFIYKSARNALWRFAKEEVAFDEIDYRFLMDFENYLRQPKEMPASKRKQKKGKLTRSLVGANDGGISNYMRTIRALFNEAIRRKYAEPSDYPFSNQFNKNGYNIGKFSSEHNPRGLSEVEWKKYKNSPAKDMSEYELYYDMSVFSYFARGMNFGDACRLKKKTNIVNGRVDYKRQKTGKRISIKINKELKLIIDKYITLYPNSEYLFPIFSEFHETAQQKFDRITNKRSFVNHQIREIAKIGGVESWEGMTWYTFRHTFITVLYYKGVGKSTLAELAGHTTEASINNYTKALGLDVLDKAEELLLDE